MEKEIRKKLFKSINYRKATDYCNYTGKHGGAAHCDLKFNVLNEIHVVFCDGSNFDYHFILKALANEFEGKFECLQENTERYKTLSVPIEKDDTKIDKDGSESVVTICYKIKFIDSVKFMATS